MENKRVTAYQLAWNLEQNAGTVRLYLEGVERPIERDLDGKDFLAVGVLLSSAGPDAPVVIGKNPAGESFMIGGRRGL